MAALGAMDMIWYEWINITHEDKFKNKKGN